MLASQQFIPIMMFTVETLQKVKENQDALVRDKKGSCIQHPPSQGPRLQHLLVDEKGGH